MVGVSKGDLSRRAAIGAGVASIAALTGCSTGSVREQNKPRLDRIVAGTSGTQKIRAQFTLVYAPRDASIQQPIRGVYEIPESTDPLLLDEFDGAPGVYNLTVSVQNSNATEVMGFNSYAPNTGRGPLQFEVFVDRDGDVDVNLARKGNDLSNPN